MLLRSNGGQMKSSGWTAVNFLFAEWYISVLDDVRSRSCQAHSILDFISQSLDLGCLAVRKRLALVDQISAKLTRCVHNKGSDTMLRQIMKSLSHQWWPQKRRKLCEYWGEKQNKPRGLQRKTRREQTMEDIKKRKPRKAHEQLPVEHKKIIKFVFNLNSPFGQTVRNCKGRGRNWQVFANTWLVCVWVMQTDCSKALIECHHRVTLDRNTCSGGTYVSFWIIR